MKKAKIMLAAIAVLAVAGGTIAFKSAKLNSLTVYTTNSDPAVCNSTVVIPNATTNSGGTPINETLVFGAATVDGVCGPITTIVDAN